MATWTQNTLVTYNDGTTKKYEPRLRSADRMVELLAQISFLRQAGEDVELHQETDDNFRTVRYIIRRRAKDREIVNTFDRVALGDDAHLQEVGKGQDFALYGQALRIVADDGETVVLYDIRKGTYNHMPRAELEDALAPAGYRLA